jgi:myo-inositol-1(or 4)-monophosphatase
VSGESQNIRELTEFAKDIIRRSGEEALRYYGKGKDCIKFDEALVTEAELHLGEFFRDELHSNFPEHRVFSDSQAETEYIHGAKRYLWIYDPLDGVANFQGGIPIWGISLALLENFWPLFGAVHLPATGDLFHALAGQDAFWGAQRIRISEQETVDDESLLLTFSRFHRYYRATFPGKIRSLGCSSAHICYVAMGRAEAVVTAGESYQGLAAAQIIVEAAGGKIFKMDGGPFFLNDYLDGGRIKEHLLIAGPHAYAQIRETLLELASS